MVNEDQACSAGRGGLAVLFAKVYFIATGLVQQALLPRAIGFVDYGVFLCVFVVSNVFNNVIVTGENAEENVTPVTAVWQVTGADPLSVTGPFGKVTKRYSSSLVTTLSQAVETAKGLLRKYRAANRTVSLTAMHNYAIEPGDCIAVRYGGAATDETHIVKTIEHPLTATSPTTAIETVSGRDEEDGE